MARAKNLQEAALATKIMPLERDGRTWNAPVDLVGTASEVVAPVAAASASAEVEAEMEEPPAAQDIPYRAGLFKAAEKRAEEGGRAA